MRSLEQSEDALAESIKEPPFYERVQDRLHAVFDGVGSFSFLGEYRSRDYDIVSIDADNAHEIEIVYDEVTDYLGRREPIGTRFWQEFLEAMEDSPDVFVMLISQRPIDIDQPLLSPTEPRVRVQHITGIRPASSDSPPSYAMVAFAVDFSEPTSDSEQERLLGLVRSHAEQIHSEARQHRRDG